ncbi:MULTISPECIES: phage holin [unclassified Methylophaga]|jgi:hypothetical protein|uniref:phage holin n=1 Tax=unclassified Methylophaga TaxID=2629249 RepID=UPI00259CDDAD|nr:MULTISPECIES: phage holin [unclassified Methylophaga]|tara:strand:- start:25499 stop:25810 length:312 start_codon:yes stop_codon:yes gene_type:complete
MRIEIAQHSAEVIAVAGQKTNNAASGALVLLGLFTPEQWGVIAIVAGIFFAFAGYITNALINWYFKAKHFRLEERRVKAQIKLDEANIQPFSSDDNNETPTSL